MNKTYAISLLSLVVLLLASCHQPIESRQSKATEQEFYQQALERELDIAKTNPWHEAKLKGASFRAIGQEPAWLIEFYPDEKIHLSRGYGEIIQNFSYQTPLTDQVKRRSVFKLESAGHVILEGKSCTDIMSGEKFETTVTVVINDQTLKGCGKSLY